MRRIGRHAAIASFKQPGLARETQRASRFVDVQTSRIAAPACSVFRQFFSTDIGENKSQVVDTVNATAATAEQVPAEQVPAEEVPASPTPEAAQKITRDPRRKTWYAKKKKVADNYILGSKSVWAQVKLLNEVPDADAEIAEGLRGVQAETIQFIREKLNDDREFAVSSLATYYPEQLGHLDSLTLIEIHKRFRSQARLHEKKERVKQSILDTLGAEELPERVAADLAYAKTLTEVKDVFRPFDPKYKDSPASVARSIGLQPFADAILQRRETREDWADIVTTRPIDSMQLFIQENSQMLSEKGHAEATAEELCSMALDIVMEEFAHDLDIKREARAWFINGAKMSIVDKGVEPTDDKWARIKKRAFGDMGNFEKPVKFVTPVETFRFKRYQVFLEREISVEQKACLAFMHNFGKYYSERDVAQEGAWGKLCWGAIDDALHEMVLPQIFEEYKAKLDLIAFDAAFKNFTSVYETKAAELPVDLKGRNILAIDAPGGDTARVAVVNAESNVLATGDIMLDQAGKSKEVMESILSKFDCGTLVIGAGTQSIKAFDFVKSIADILPSDMMYIPIPNIGTASFQKERMFLKENSNIHYAYIGAVGAAKYIIDPLKECTKISPTALGVGFHQRDVDQKTLNDNLNLFCVSLVSKIGVDVKKHGPSLLCRVPGISGNVATLVASAAEKESVKCLADLQEVLKKSYVSGSVFDSASGFLRFEGSTEPLDNTYVQIRDYDLARKIQEIQGEGPYDATDPALGELGDRVEFVVNALNASHQPRYGKSTLYRIPVSKLGALADSSIDPYEQADGVFNGIASSSTGFGTFVAYGYKKDGIVHKSRYLDDYPLYIGRPVLIELAKGVKSKGHSDFSVVTPERAAEMFEE
eukprot:CAMPEP_0203747726 /NCGR_PEP_ID=MMETSP0098-20131031/2788_1 /ASSEMBLY_ACC=CAM_ASM_000208 /TAXON_ID=96639 /ORGANISM=" , Strain NY0313808BC1" /LENGTH=876 /DNA_ID=CAMNT_0050636239 /DNA_START=157 /DNA_END=2787 /DNA_ORIENTATION=-